MPDINTRNDRRYLSVWFPLLSTDRLRREEGRSDASAEPATVLVEKVKGALRLAASNRQALEIGLSPGMTLADARARAPDIRVVVHRPEADAALLKRVLLDFGRFTPMAATDGLDGMALDVTGCAHLFGGEMGMMQAVEARSRRVGLSVRLAMAGTPEAARALARFGSGGIYEGANQRQALRRLPVAALELSDKETQALSRAGLKTLAHLDDRPTAPIAARFGAVAATRLNRVLGREDTRIRPERPVMMIAVSRILVEPITEMIDVEAVIGDLLLEVMDQLDLRGQGGRAFRASFFRVDGEVRHITVRTGRPSRDASGVLRLFRERLAALAKPLDPGFGFDQLRLSAPVTDRLASRQGGFERIPPGAEDLGRLVDRLTARLGPESVRRFELVESHWPERAVRLTPVALPSGEQVDWPEPDPVDPPLRPLQMFDPPQPILATAEVPDHPPNRFIWRRVDHRLVRVEGPERIAPEWWRRLRGPLEATRDYYRVEDQEGRRFWLFRSGFYGEEPAPRWFLHGVFA
ncbi:protein ImuB [Brevundimonas vesicularis]|uniref:Y-family DNA polymerase n=1 Tax=Brevundimonas vesicularis TaxID=41276 RepID=UPI00277DCCE1|nr:DNA polymerase Y family protein [Brevundimonas vesicularis]MDQ1192940.1 protein ImuB [Brevundimonas vesicularis]